MWGRQFDPGSGHKIAPSSSGGGSFVSLLSARSCSSGLLLFDLMGTMTTSVAHQTDRSRFVITVDGEEAGFAEYSDSATTREFTHTEIYEAFQGQGLSKPLIKAALDDDSTIARQVIPTCSAVARFIEKNPEYQRLTNREGSL